jgi:hypothetical protein
MEVVQTEVTQPIHYQRITFFAFSHEKCNALIIIL